MQKHITRVAGGGAATILFGVALLVTDIPKALEQADKSFAFIGKSLGFLNPPDHFVSMAWQHPWVVILAFSAAFAIGVGSSWGVEAIWRRFHGRKLEPPPVSAFGFDDGRDAGQQSEQSPVATLSMRVTRAPRHDVSLTEAALYAVTGKWGMIGGKEHFATNQERMTVGNRVADWLADFEQKASDGSVRVWGRPQENSTGPLVEIDALHWRTHEAFPISVALGEPQSRQRLSMSREGGYNDLRVNRAEFEREWPHAA